MSENLCLDVAQRRVRDYTDEADAAISASHEAEGCWKCQDFLQKGIDAYKWLKKAEEFLREADYQGLQQFTPELQNAVDAMYNSWVHPCETAEEWASVNLARGYQIDNLQLFRETCNEVREVIQNREWRKSAKHARILAASDDPHS